MKQKGNSRELSFRDSYRGDLVQVGLAGTLGTIRLLENYSDRIKSRFSKSYILAGIKELLSLPVARPEGEGLCLENLEIHTADGTPAAVGETDLQAKRNCGELSSVKKLLVDPFFFRRFSIGRVQEVREGGILRGLWEFCEGKDALGTGASLEEGQSSRQKSCGCRYRYDRMLFSQFTVELCEYFSLSPFQLLSGNCYLVQTDRGQLLSEQLLEYGIHASVIGSIHLGTRRIRVDGEHDAFLRRNEKDALSLVEEEGIL